jgi:hypothetical protein
MCLAVYIASNKELPLIPWDENNRRLNVSKEDESNQVKKHLGKKYLYYVGSHSGCGCGFVYGDYVDDENEEELKRKSFEDLITYLKDNIEDEGFEVYCCWEGDESEKKEFESEIELEKFKIPDHFIFKEKEHIDIKK